MRSTRPWHVIGPATIVLVALLAVVAIAISSTQSSTRHALENGFAEHAKVSAALTSSLFHSTAATSSAQDAKLFGARHLNGVMLTNAARSGSLSDLVLLAGDGKIIAASANTPRLVLRQIDAQRGFLQRALSGGELAISDLISIPRQGALIELAQPFHTPSGTRVLVSGFSTQLLSGFIGSYLAGSATTATTHAFLIDGNGRIIATSSTANQPAALNGTLAAAIAHHQRGGYGNDEYFTSGPVKGSDWRVIATISQSVLFAPVRGATSWLPWALFAAFACVLALLLALGGRLLHAAATQRVADARLRAQAERANQAKSEFLSRMSHELRTPLNAVVGFGQLLELDELKPAQREGVEQILKAGRHLLNLINEVLDISRIEAGTISLSLEPVDLGSVVAESLSLIRPLAEKAGVRLTVDPGELADVYVRADNHRLKQVLVNVLANAVKYNRRGGEVKGSFAALADGRVEFEISDTGCGIPAEELERIFEPFDRLGAERTGVEGTGLGLALSRQLMQAMSGAIKAESEPDVGTTIRLVLDGDTPPVDELDQLPVATAANGAVRATVVYIEDNPSNLRLVERAFERLSGIRLITAMQGGIGIELIREHHPQLVLLDLHLPDMPGADVLERLKQDAATAAIPVLVVSADATPRQIERLQSAGAIGYMTKPLDIAQLLETVDTQLTSHV
jgi:signal transduction histidine kinase/ActR/RegA family two-component response regulator